MTLLIVICRKSLSLALAGLLFLSLKSVLADPAADFDYEVHSYYEAGQAVGCDFYIMALNAEGQFVAVNLGIFMEPIDPDVYKSYSMFKVTSKRVDLSVIEKYLLGQGDLNYQETPLNVNHAWIATNTGTTVNKMKTTATGLVFLAGTPDFQVVNGLLPGLLDSGVTIGVQELPGSLDTVIEIADPPSEDVRNKFIKCLNAIENSINALSGERN